MSCDAVLGQAHCTEAHIYPDDNCFPVSPLWSGASLHLASEYLPDSLRFTIKNTGTGNMPAVSDYRILKDAELLTKEPFQLASGDSVVVAVPADGSTWRVEIDQVPYHPGLSAPSLSVEGCSNVNLFSTGFVTQLPNDDADAWIDIDCMPNDDWYELNDKKGLPTGYGQEHYIQPGVELEYCIRFQNGGADTISRIRITDTLSTWLDATTFRPGTSSHPYQFDLTGSGTVDFLFENIELPDSNVNHSGSSGFVKFSIYPKADAPLKTLIKNTAYIDFENNNVAVTNATWHRLGENFVTVGLWQPRRPEYKIIISPNPFNKTALLEIKGLVSNQPVHLQVIDLQGKVVYNEIVYGSVITLRKTNLKAGVYFFNLNQHGIAVGSGKLVVEN